MYSIFWLHLTGRLQGLVVAVWPSAMAALPPVIHRLGTSP
ncbi:hypothetical protein SGRA_3507 [Saprospira grandis str. Lewin]|uniref:Uncharacterized protein n=1 Tax=Saprospira grandis (strain Lewin) TaxID=984262 RepID=H6L067_SAPGL|nr:hypothetical protein SGRA_3507 [Saprospira grandis str. Lewin]